MAPHAGLEGSAAGPGTCVSSGCVPQLSEAAPARPCCAMLSAAGPYRATLPGLQAGAKSFLQEANPVLGKADLQSSGTSSPSHRSPSAYPGLPLQDRGLRNCWGPFRLTLPSHASPLGPWRKPLRAASCPSPAAAQPAPSDLLPGQQGILEGYSPRKVGGVPGSPPRSCTRCRGRLITWRRARTLDGGRLWPPKQSWSFGVSFL